MVAIEAPLLYALSRVLMFLQVPGFRGLEGEVLVVGLGLAAASAGGAVLTWGLVAGRAPSPLDAGALGPSRPDRVSWSVALSREAMGSTADAA